jgi:very-short-patch-repair endonuclease
MDIEIMEGEAMKKKLTRSEKKHRLETLSLAHQRHPTPSEERFLFILYQVRKYLRLSRDLDIGQIYKQQTIMSNSVSTGYILDFYLPRLSLAYEIDGPSHDKRTEYDQRRDAFVAAKGIETVRYKNREVFADDFRDRLREDVLAQVQFKFPNGSPDLHYDPLPFGTIKESRYLTYMKERHLRQ